MNCLAHAIRFLDEPWFVAGACLPDWLSMCDRKVRLRPKHVDPISQRAESLPASILARGIQQHWHDDDWFHRTPAFHSVSNQIGQLFKNAFDADDNFRAGFLGHIATELLIDGLLSVRHPTALDDYYNAIEQIDPHELQRLVNAFGAKTTENIVPFLARYNAAQFLRDYADDERLLFRLNQVLHRVRLPQLPGAAVPVVAESRVVVDNQLVELISSDILSGRA